MPVGTAKRETSDQAPFARRQWQVILAATAVAAVLRLLWLGEWSLWVDEAHTWRDATMPLTGEDGFLSTGRSRYPLTFLLLRFLFGIGALGFDEWQLRLPFALLGICTVPLLAVCGRRLVGSWPATIACALLAINPWHIFWSQNARGYVIVVLAAVLAIHRLHVFWHTRRIRDLALALIWVVLGATSHGAAATLLFGFLGFVVVRRILQPPARYGYLKVLLLAGFVLLPLPWLLQTSWIQSLNPWEEFFDSKGNPSLAHWLQTVVYYFRPGMLLCAGVALLLAPRVLGRTRTMYLACLVMVPLVLLTAVGAQIAKTTARYGICTLPVVLLLVGFLIHEVALRLAAMKNVLRVRSRWLAALLPALLVGDFLRLDLDYYTSQYGQRGRYREAAQFLQDEVAARGFDGLRLLTVSRPTMFYYLRRRHWFVTDGDPYPNIDLHAMVKWRWLDGLYYTGSKLHDPGVDNHFEWHRRSASGKRRLFAVLTRLPEMREKDVDGTFEVALRRDFELALHLPVWVGPKDESIYIFLPKSEPR